MKNSYNSVTINPIKKWEEEPNIFPKKDTDDQQAHAKMKCKLKP